jgi:RimJ/RimL family protein N-acetyltransferase
LELPDVIEAQRIVIRPFRAEDKEAFVSFMTDENATSEFMFSEGQKTPYGAQAFFDQIVSSYSTEKPYFFYTIALRGSAGFIGAGGVSSLPENGTFECSCCLIPGRRGYGYATEAIRALIEYCFASYEIEEFKTYIDPRNRRSIAIANRLGMDHAGNGKHPIHGDDSEVYVANKNDWMDNDVPSDEGAY